MIKIKKVMIKPKSDGQKIDDLSFALVDTSLDFYMSQGNQKNQRNPNLGFYLLDLLIV